MNRLISIGLSIAVAPALLLAYGLWRELPRVIEVSRDALFQSAIPIGGTLAILGIAEALLQRCLPSQYEYLSGMLARQRSSAGRIFNLVVVSSAALIAVFAVGNAALRWVVQTQAPPIPSNAPPPGEAADKSLWLDENRLRELVSDLRLAEQAHFGGFDCSVVVDRPQGPASRAELRGEQDESDATDDEDPSVTDDCTAAEAAAVSEFERERNLVSGRWIPILSRASDAGDPVAEVLLRICSTAPQLDRGLFKSDCSTDEEDRLFALARLQKLDFTVAVIASAEQSRRETPTRSCPRSDEECAMDPHKGVLAAMTEGYLWGEELERDCDVTPHRGEAALRQQCRRLRTLTRSIATQSPRSYTKGLSLTERTHPGSVDVVAGSGKRDLDAVVAEARAYADAIASKIDKDLSKEPRWKFFLATCEECRPL